MIYLVENSLIKILKHITFQCSFEQINCMNNVLMIIETTKRKLYDEYE